MLLHSCANGIQVKNDIFYQSVDISNRNTDSQEAMAQSVERSTPARKVLGRAQFFFLFVQNLRTNASCEGLGKKSVEDCHITHSSQVYHLKRSEKLYSEFNINRKVHFNNLIFRMYFSHENRTSRDVPKLALLL